MTLMSRASSWLTDTLEDAAGVTVTYTRGGESVTLTATVGRTLFSLQQPGNQGNRIEWGERDYLFRAADLGGLFPPQKGDRLTEVLPEGTVTFEGLPPAGEPLWRWSDAERTVVRMHCKRARTT